jgi:hypothetical protein
MDCKQFARIILAFLIWVGIQTQLPNLRQNVSTIIPANYGQYSEDLIQHIINTNQAGAVDTTSADLLRSNMAQYAALAAGATATQFFDVNGNILFDITSPEPFQQGSEEATLWGELKGLWQTINQTFSEANFTGKMLALMQMIGILKCAKWCWTTASDCVLGAIDLGKWSYNMLAGLVRGPLSTTTTGVQDSTVHPNSPNQRLRGTVKNMIIQMRVINKLTQQAQQAQQAQVQTTLNDILTKIETTFTSHSIGPQTPEKLIIPLENFKHHKDNPYANTDLNPTGDFFTYYGGRPRTKRRPYKSKRRRPRSSKKRRHYKTKKRVYRSTRFRTHR